MCALETTPAIGTDRLILRRPTMADAALIAELANDVGVAGMLTSMPHPYERRHADEFLAKVQGMDPSTDRVFAIDHRTLGLIGMIGFHEKQPRRPEVGYWLGRPFWGRGYATEAVKAALRWAKSEWRRKVVWAGHFSDNRASGQVLAKAGFLYTGDVVLQDCPARGCAVPTRMMVWLA